MMFLKGIRCMEKNYSMSMKNSPFCCLFFWTFVSFDIEKEFEGRKSPCLESFHCFGDFSLSLFLSLSFFVVLKSHVT